MFELLVRNFHRTARVWARRILDDDDLVEDAVQEALIIAFERLHQLRRPEAVAGWLKQIVVRQCYRHVQQLRRGREYERGEGHLPESPLDPAEVAEQTDESTRLQLFYYEGYAQQDVARLLRVPVGTVKKRLHDAQRRLRGHLEP